ncbi:MAG: pitrilysin family protein [Nautiliaceae bacterium]
MLHKFYKETLKNKLEVVAIPMNKGSKVITTNVFYKVGSRNEILGKTGIAHMLEHMNFKSTKNLKEGEFDKIVKSLGGVDNASTGFDYTHYFIKTSNEYLNKTFWLFSETMANLKLDKEEFERERKVVYEERLWRVDNNPMGYLYFRLFNNTFIYHPYHWTPIGFKDDILNWKIEDIREFYNTYYQPKNAILLVAGDIEVEEVFREAWRYFEGIENKKEIPKLHQKEPKLDGDKRVYIKKETNVDMMALAFHTKEFNDSSLFALNAYAEILSSGQSSLLKEKFVNKKRLFSEIFAFHMDLRDKGVFIVVGILNKGVNKEKAIKEVRKTLLDTKITKKMLTKVKNQTKFDFISSLESSSSVSNLYGEFLAKGDIKPLLEYEEKINSLTPQDIEEAKKFFIKGVEVILHS